MVQAHGFVGFFLSQNASTVPMATEKFGIILGHYGFFVQMMTFGKEEG